MKPTLTRRAALASALALALPEPVRARSLTLRDACRLAGVLSGAARDHVVVPEDPALDRLIAAECDLVAPENGGKWAVLQPEDGVFDWRRLDLSVALAERIGARPVWHCVLWQHMGMPDYMKLPAARSKTLGVSEPGYFAAAGTLSRGNQWPRFTAYIDAVAARYGDRFYRIDVANEVFYWETAATHPHEQDRFGFRKGMWWDAGGGAEGPEWLDPYFAYVRARFPTARLVINEWGVEIAEGWQQRKRRYLLDWLKGARLRGVPVDGLGLQSHLVAGKPYDQSGMVRFLTEVTDLGLPIHITECDVDEERLPARWPRDRIDRALAATLRPYLDDIVRHGRLAELTWWGLRSDLSFIARRMPDRDPRPLPYDGGGGRLPLYDAAVAALAGQRSG